MVVVNERGCPCNGDCCDEPCVVCPEHVCVDEYICEDCHCSECVNCGRSCHCDL